MKKCSKFGFTLIELMMVMLLMVLITTITVSGSFGMSRAASYTAAQEVVYGTLQTARQKACLDGKPVFVILQDDETVSVVEGVGSVTDADSNGFYDRAASLDIDSGKDRVWNLTTGAHIDNVRATSDVNDTGTTGNGKLNVVIRDDDDSYVSEVFGYSFRQSKISGSGFKKSEWNIGDSYGFEVIPSKRMPKGFKMGLNSVSAKPNFDIIVFNPDGSGGIGTKNSAGISVSTGKVTVYVYETIVKAENRAVKVTIDNGKIKQE